jgi:hypothetical protein
MTHNRIGFREFSNKPHYSKFAVLQCEVNLEIYID